MERQRIPSRHRRLTAGALLSTLALSSCANESVKIEADTPAMVVGIYEQSQLATPDDATGYAHYESTYWLIVKQCSQDSLLSTDRDDCNALKTPIAPSVIHDYKQNDTVHFSKDLHAEPASKEEIAAAYKP